MASFSNDVDLIKYEPILFSELYFPSQVLVTGTGGVVSSTTFTASGENFVSAAVAAGQIVYLKSDDGLLEGSYEIVSVDSATQLTISVVRSDCDEDAIAPPAATNVSYRISTFGPQTGESYFQLTEYFGIQPGDPASDISVDDILDVTVLKQASVYAVLSGVYATLASKAEDENFWRKSLHYKRLFEKARERCRLSFDTGSDGIADITSVGASVRLVRD